MKKIEIDYERLSQICFMEQEEFQGLGEYHEVNRKGYTTYKSTYDAITKTTTRVPITEPDDKSFYLFQDNGAKVLAVVHLDTVIETWENWTFEKATLTLGSNRNKKTFTKLWNPQLDDRLGAYILLDLLPKFLGHKAYDILFTTDEETSNSTAAQFELPEGKDYNWIFQFDRRGTGAVLYQYDSPEWKAAVNEYLPVQVGSFSDICKLYWLGCKGVNVGTGYHDEHGDYCYMIEEEVINQVKNFILFFQKNKDTKFLHTARADYSYDRTQAYGWDGDSDYWNGVADSGYKSFRATTSTTPSGASQPFPRLQSPLVTGAPRMTGVQRLDGNTDENDSEIDDDTEEMYEGEFEDRDMIHDTNDRTMIRSVLKSMTSYDKDGNYIGLRERDGIDTDLNLVSASMYYSTSPVDWVDLPAVRKVNTLFQYDADAAQVVFPPTLVPIYHNPITGKRALYCKSCSICTPLEEVLWSRDAIPVCFDCSGTFPAGVVLESATPPALAESDDLAYEIPLSDDKLRWVSEGGGLRTGLHTIRTFTGVDKHIERCYCDLCNQAEWPDKALTFSNDLFTQGEDCTVCRECFEIYQDVGVNEGDKSF